MSNLNTKIILYGSIGTKYLTPYTSSKIKALFKQCKEQYESTGVKIEIDIKHCKFNPDNYIEVCTYCDYIHFVDSVNSVIDSMLDHNSRVSTIRKLEDSGKIVIEPIPSVFDAKQMYEYVKNLDRSKVYRLKGFRELNGITPDVSILIAMSINYLYPDVSIDLSEQTVNYFSMFKKFWIYSGIVKRDSYNLLWNGNILKIDFTGIDSNGDNLFYVPGVGTITENTLNDSFQVIPYEFGSEKDLEEDLELCDIFESITNELQKLLKKKKKKKLTSELTTIERG